MFGMTKSILVEECNSCPYQDKTWSKDGKRIVPTCLRKGLDLPYIIEAIKDSSVGAYRVNATGVIPVWCPLEDHNND